MHHPLGARTVNPGTRKVIGTSVNPILARLLQTAAVFIGAKLLEALIAELSAMEKEVKKKQKKLPIVLEMIQGGKRG